MMSQLGSMRLFEALDLRADYDARIRTIRRCAEGAESKPVGRDAGPGAGDGAGGGGCFVPVKLRQSQMELERRRDALDDAIRAANLSHVVVFRGRRMTLGEAFALRGELSRAIGELEAVVVRHVRRAGSAAEARPMPPAHGFSPACVGQLDEARRAFRALNRLLWNAAYAVQVRGATPS